MTGADQMPDSSRSGPEAQSIPGEATSIDLGVILSEYAVASLSFDGSILSAAKQKLLDTIGCALAAQDEEAVRMARAYASAHRGGGKAVIWGTQIETCIEAAVFANTAACRFLDYNDAYLGRENLHPSDVIPALIAVAHAGNRSGRALLEAIGVAYQVGITLCDSFNLRDRGWDHVAITRFAGICGIGRLLGLTPGQIGHALSISAVAHNATRQSRTGDLSMWKGLAAADAMKSASYACELAQAGIEGPAGAFTGAHGFTERILDGAEPDGSVLLPLQELRPPQRVSDSNMKLMPFAYAGHSAAEAAAEIGKGADLSPTEVESVLVETYDVAYRIMAQPESWKPMSRETADHSIPYVVTYALFNGGVDPAAFDPSQYGRADYHEFMSEKVRVTPSDELTEVFPNELPSRVTLRTKSGSVVLEETRTPYGHASRPASDEDLLAKFVENVRSVGGQTAHAVAEQIENLETAITVGTLVGHLTGTGTS